MRTCTFTDHASSGLPRQARTRDSCGLRVSPHFTPVRDFRCATDAVVGRHRGCDASAILGLDSWEYEPLENTA
jgi:hypothetical protein